MRTIDNETKAIIRKTQAVLMQIKNEIPVFFNLVEYRDKLGLIKDSGKKTSRNTTKWVLTEKGNMFLNFAI